METFPKVCGFIASFVVWFVIMTTLTLKGSAYEMTSTTPWSYPVDCRPYQMKSMKVLLKVIGKCTRELKANSTSNKDFEEHMGCAIKCAMQLLGCLDNGVVTQESLARSTRALVPDQFVQPLVKLFMDSCQKKYGALLDPQEPQCRSYSEYAFCIQSSIGDLMETEQYCIQHKKDEKGTSTEKVS